MIATFIRCLFFYIYRFSPEIFSIFLLLLVLFSCVLQNIFVICGCNCVPLVFFFNNKHKQFSFYLVFLFDIKHLAFYHKTQRRKRRKKRFKQVDETKKNSNKISDWSRRSCELEREAKDSSNSDWTYLRDTLSVVTIYHGGKGYSSGSAKVSEHRRRMHYNSFLSSGFNFTCFDNL